MAKIIEFEDWFRNQQADSFKDILAKAKSFEDIHKITTGFCGEPTFVLLNEICKNFLDPDEQYLEIGCFGGTSLCGALRDNSVHAQVIDPLPDAFKPGGTKTILEWFTNAVNHFGLTDRITLHRMRYQDFDKDIPKIGLYFYDGAHEQGTTYPALKEFEKYLADTAIIIVDDLLHEPWIEREVNLYIENSKFAQKIGVFPFSMHQIVIIFCRENN